MDEKQIEQRLQAAQDKVQTEIGRLFCALSDFSPVDVSANYHGDKELCELVIRFGTKSKLNALETFGNVLERLTQEKRP